MATLGINGKRVEVDDSFLALSPEEQQSTVDEIASQLGVVEQPPEEPEGGFMAGAKDVAKSIGAGIPSGIASVADLPAMVGQLGQAGVIKAYEMITGERPPAEFIRGLQPELPLGINLTKPYARMAAEKVAPDVMGFEPETRLGKYAKTGTEFTTGAALTGGMGQAVRYGLLPGLASEAAGQMTEGKPAEPYARTAAALGTALLAGPRSAAYTRGAGADELEMANRLSKAGVKPTAGQLADSPNLMRAEGTSGPTGKQIEDFTRAALRTAGNTTDKLATAPVLRRTQNTITKGMNDILKDVDVPITTNLGQRTLSVADDYFAGSAGGQIPPALRRINDSLLDVATQPGGASSIPAATLRKWRTTAGAYTSSPQEMTREAAHALRELIDDASEAALSSLGRADDIEKLGVLRNQYRNFLTIADASTKGGRQGARGILTPERVSSAATRTVGKTNRATGKGTDLTELSNDALAMIGAAPTTAPGAFRNVAIAGGGAGAGATVGSLLGGLPGAMIGAGVGATTPLMVQGLTRNPTVQNLLTNPSALTQSAPVLPGLLSQ